MNLTIDYETRSRVDLRKAGAIKYAQDPSTQIMCVAYKLGDRETKLWVPGRDKIDTLFLDLLRDPRITIVAHNAGFEQAMTAHCLSRYPIGVDVSKIPPSRWKCTAAKAAAHALPRHLEGACLALNLPVKKDMDGRRLMLKYCKPRKHTKTNKNDWHDDPIELQKLYDYCKNDVEAEYLLDKALPDLSPFEQNLWCLDQEINQRGIKVDLEAIKKILAMIEVETGNLKNEVNEITFGLLDNVTQRNELLRFLDSEGFSLPDLQAKTVKDALDKGDVNGDSKRLLQIRQLVSKTSTKKFQAFLDRVCRDGNVRDLLIFHGASTGRWAGSGIQPQNFPRGSIADTDLAISLIKENDLETLKLFYGDVMTLFSSVIRGMLVSDKGEKFYCADFASIEVRVLFWLAGHMDGLKAFAENRDLYKEMAAVIYGILVGNVTKPQRELGKRAVLGCGYGMGKKKFYETCKAFDMEVTEELAETAVQAYRQFHVKIPKLWKLYEAAAVKAVRDNVVVRIARTKWFVKDKFLYCELPSGRKLAYYKPSIKAKKLPWGEVQVLHHFGVNPRTKQWEECSTYGGLLVENVTQAVARDFMAEAMVRLKSKQFDIRVTVHDEILATHSRSMPEEIFIETMRALPMWAAGCPINAEGWIGDRYRK